MDQQDKQGPGLHKEVSTIFDGVPLPNGGGPRAQTESNTEAHGAGSPTAAQAIAGIGAGKSDPTVSKPHPFNTPIVPESPRGVVKPIKKRTDFINNLLAKVVPPDLDDSTARRQKVMALLIPVLAVILVLVFVKVLGKPARSDASVNHSVDQTTESESEDTGETTETAETEEEIVRWELPGVFSKPVRDPMISELFGPSSPAGGGSGGANSGTAATDEQQAAQLMNLEVTGILYSKDRPAAIVGTEIVHEGDTVLGATVVEIQRDSIELELDGRRWKQGLRQ
jgi:hypothetical protein